jgi:hypothetical protein
VGQLLTLEIARAREDVTALLPARAWQMLLPSVRRAASSGVRLQLYSDEPIGLDSSTIEVRSVNGLWPGQPVLAAIDDRVGLLATAQGDRVSGHWSAAATMVAAARLAIQALG